MVSIFSFEKFVESSCLLWHRRPQTCKQVAMVRYWALAVTYWAFWSWLSDEIISSCWSLQTQYCIHRSMCQAGLRKWFSHYCGILCRRTVLSETCLGLALLKLLPQCPVFGAVSQTWWVMFLSDAGLRPTTRSHGLSSELHLQFSTCSSSSSPNNLWNIILKIGFGGF